MPNTLRPGHVVRASTLGHRVFVDDTHGFALANVGEAQYPVATANGGRTWRVNGPALHLNAAQAPLSICEVGALDRRNYWADGCGGQVVDTTNDAGKHWWRSLFEGGVLSVVSSGGRLLVLVESFTPASTQATIQVYASTDKGRNWHFESGL
ncbi:MAG TPA: sialidase family protein [Solirubrobacteraceae bacterium]|nr:sialidase family protein [Solirubrobacteraceae bacterium]